MKIVEIEALKETIPFVPFTIFLSDGRKYQVLHPDYLFPIAPIDKLILVSETYDMYAIISVSHITGVEIRK